MVTEKTACRATVNPIGTVTSQAITLGASAVAGDVVVLVVCAGGNSTTIAASGLGATWTAAARVTTNSPSLTVLVGTGITSPGTSITISNIPTNTMSAVATAYTGLTDSAAVIGSSGSVTNAGATSVTTTAVTATAGRLLIGAAAHNGVAANDVNAPTWSSGDTNTRVSQASNGGTSPTR